MVAHHNYPPPRWSSPGASFPARPSRQTFTGRERSSSAPSFTCRTCRRTGSAGARTRRRGGGRGSGALLSVPMLREGSPIGAITVVRGERGAVLRQAHRAAADLRRPGGDRRRERAAVQGAGGAQRRADRGAGAADGDGRDPPGHQQLADRRPAGVRDHRRQRRASVRSEQLRRVRPRWRHGLSGRHGRPAARCRWTRSDRCSPRRSVPTSPLPWRSESVASSTCPTCRA